MTLQECYAAMGGNYESAVGRLRSERLVQKFILKFLDDGSYDLLCKSLEDGYTPEAGALAEEVRADYSQTVDAIRAFQKESAG